MKIQMVDINTIKPDKNQPRHTVDMVRVHEMSKSILTEGVINPIEIDEKNIIVTGEMRWRAAKEAGLKQVPCKVVDFRGRDRFRRQVIENVHHNTMTTMDTAEALEKLLSYNTTNGVRHSIEYGDLKRLSEEVGKSDRYIQDQINLLKESPKVREWLRKPDSKMSLIREINKFAPSDVKEELKDKVVEGEIGNYRVVTELSKALRDAPDKKDELMSIDWSSAKDNDVKRIHDIVPILESEDHIDTAKSIEREIGHWYDSKIFFRDHLPEDFSPVKVAQAKAVFEEMIQLGNSFFTRVNLIKGEEI